MWPFLVLEKYDEEHGDDNDIDDNDIDGNRPPLVVEMRR